VTERTLSPRALGRALLARQHLLERTTRPIDAVVEDVGGLQTQYAPSGYVGLWTRVEGFRRDDLTSALEDRRIVQATLMRTTIHMVSRRDYWPYVAGITRARRAWALRVQPRGDDEAAMLAKAERLRTALADGPRTVKELGDLGAGFVGNLGLWVDLVRVPPSGTWERRRADRLGLAEDWVGPPNATEEAGLRHLVRTYLGAFGPAPWRDIASWSGVPVTVIRRGGEGLTLVRYRGEDGRELVDLPDAPLPDPGTPAPVRFLPHWDAVLLAHARRTGILPETYRSRIFSSKNPFSVGTVLVDGGVVATWSIRDGQVVVEPLEAIGDADRRAIEDERAGLQALHAP
jgi:Winged helix DNA-binding domain